MKYRIVQYIQPWEIDDLDRQADQLIRGAYYIPSGCTVIIDVTMNTDVVDWTSSKLPIEYFINKFNYIASRLSNYFKVEFDTDIAISGCTDKRRVCAAKDQDFVIWLDSDLYFPSNLLPLMIVASTKLNDECFILTPQIIKYWDQSWDCITHPEFLNQPHNYRDVFDLYSVDAFSLSQESGILRNTQIKFGGGWFNLIKTTVLNRIPLVDELGSYAPDDTYLSHCGMALGIPQYILTGLVVSEIGKRYLDGKDYIKSELSVKIKDKEKITDDDLTNLIKEFILKFQKGLIILKKKYGIISNS